MNPQGTQDDDRQGSADLPLDQDEDQDDERHLERHAPEPHKLTDLHEPPQHELRWRHSLPAAQNQRALED